MPLTQEVRNLFQGVSTLPQHQRSSANVSEQANCAVYQGRLLGSRPATHHIAHLDDSPSGEASISFINRSATEKYIAVVLNGEVKVYDAFSGAEITVYAPDGFAYVAQTTLGYRFLTVEDRTFVVNRLVNTQRGSEAAEGAGRWDSLVVVRQGNFGTKYSVTLQNITVSYTTPASTTAGAEEAISTDTIAEELFDLLEAEVAFDGHFTFTLFGSAIHIQPTVGGYYQLSTADGLGNEGMAIIRGSIQRFEDLPEQAPDGYIVEIVGDDVSAFDNFWVEYSEALGAWEERLAPNAVLGFDSSTMPHLLEYKGAFLEETAHDGSVSSVTFSNDDLVLAPNSLVGKKIRNKTDGSEATITSNGISTVTSTSLAGGARNTFESGDIVDVVGYEKYFIFKPAPWSDRRAGDDSTNRFPSFIGKPIRDMYVSQGRLCFVADYSIVGSQTRNIFNLFRPTVTQVLDDHPFDITEALPSSSQFHSAVEWGGQYVIFSDLAQYVVVGEPILSPKTVSIRRIASFQNSALVKPVSDGVRIFYVGLVNGLSRVSELKTDSEDSNPYADALNEHALTYFSGVPIRLATDETSGVLMLLTREGTLNNLYVCSYKTERGEMYQRAWGKWILFDSSALEI